MDIRRALIIGLGSSSAAALCKLREQFTVRRMGDMPVVKTVLIDREGNDHQLAPDVHIISLKADENPVASNRVLTAIDALIDDLLQIEHVNRLQKANIRVQNQSPIELIIVGNLADELVHNSILELTKTIYPQIGRRQNVIQSRAASLFLAFPLLGSTGSAPDDTRQRIRDCIRSINVYLQQASQLYALDDADQAVRYVYLIEPMNKEQLALPSVDALLWMTGDWLYYYLTDSSDSSLDEKARTQSSNNEAPGYFRSLGYASLFVPVERMTAILCDWFITAAFANYLLAPPRPPDDPQGRQPKNDDSERYFQKLAEERRQKESLTSERIEADLRVTNQSGRRVINPAKFSNAPFHQYQLMERGLASEFDLIISEELPKLSEQQGEKQREILKQVELSLINIRTYYLDEYENGVRAPVRTAIRIFEILSEEFNRRSEVQRQTIIAKETEIEAKDKAIRNRRATFWDAAQTFGTPPFIFPIAAALITLVTIPYLAWIARSYLNQMAPAAVVIVATLLTMIGGFFLTINRIETLKADCIKLYADRLDLVMKQQEARVLRNLYVSLAALAHTFQTDMLRFKDLLQSQIDDRVDEKRSPYAPVTIEELESSISPEVALQLYDTPRYILERSIIERDDLRRWYVELFANLDRDLSNFFTSPQGRHLSAWFTEMIESSQSSQQTLRAALERWVTHDNLTKLPRLLEEPITRYLSRHEHAQQKDMVEQEQVQQKQLIENMCHTSHIYSRLNTTDSRGQGAQEQTQIWVAGKDSVFIGEIFKRIGGDQPTIVKTTEPWHVVSLSVLPQQPLDAFLALRDLDTGGSGPNPPDPLDSLTNTRLSTSAIAALAGPTRVIYLGEGGFGYDRTDPELEMLYGTDNARVFTVLGDTYSVVVSFLQKPTEGDHLQTVRQQVMQALQDLAAQDPSGRTLVLKLREYVDQSSIDLHERTQINNYIKLLVNRYKASPVQP